MICNRCGERFALFPEGDWVLEGSFVPITDFAEANGFAEKITCDGSF